MIVRLFRYITDTWGDSRRARLVYIVMTVGFVALAAGGVVAGDALVATVASVAAAVTAVLAALAPRLAAWTRTPERSYEENTP
jgi:hypothetical protein